MTFREGNDYDALVDWNQQHADLRNLDVLDAALEPMSKSPWSVGVSEDNYRPLAQIWPRIGAPIATLDRIGAPHKDWADAKAVVALVNAAPWLIAQAKMAEKLYHALRNVSEALHTNNIDISGLSSQYPAVYEVGKAIALSRDVLDEYTSQPEE